MIISLSMPSPHSALSWRGEASALKIKERTVKLFVQWVALYGLLLRDNPAVVHLLEVIMFPIFGSPYPQ